MQHFKYELGQCVFLNMAQVGGLLDIQTVCGIVAAIVAIITAWHKLYEVASSGKLKLREDYKFARDFFADLETNKDIHPFAKEKGYQAIAGTTAIKSFEVAYILTLEDPARSLRDFVLAKKYIEHLDAGGDMRIVFAKKYRSGLSRNVRKFFYIAVYGFFAFGALSPIIFAAPAKLQPKQLLAFMTITIPVLGFISWVGIQSFARIYRGEKLVENQQKHTKHVVTSDSW